MDRIADILAQADRLGLLHKKRGKETGYFSTPETARASDRQRLKSLGLPFDAEAEEATEYAIWLRAHPSFACAYCGRRIPRNPRKRHADHVIPLCRGGRHAVGNIVPACQRCNVSKHKAILAVMPEAIRKLSPEAWLKTLEPVATGWDWAEFERWCSINS